MARLFTLLLVGLFAAAAFACADKYHSVSGSVAPPAADAPSSTAAHAAPTVAASTTPAAAEQGPPGWEPFSDDAFSGYIPAGGRTGLISASSINAGAATSFADKLDPGTVNSLATAIASNPQLSFFFVTLDPEEGFATNVNFSFPCLSALQAPPGGQQGVDAYARSGIPAKVAGSVTYNGSTATLHSLAYSSKFDTYQATLHTGTCYQIVTLSTAPGAADAVDEFETFIANLHIDPAKHHQ
jgi:hypothetical protein